MKKKWIRKDPFEGLTQQQIARKFPLKASIIECLVFDDRKLKSLALLFEKLQLKINPTRDGKWFNVAKMED